MSLSFELSWSRVLCQTGIRNNRSKPAIVRRTSLLRSTTVLLINASAGRLKMRDMKMRDQFARVENAGKVSMESQSVKKCLKVVVFVCRVIPSV